MTVNNNDLSLSDAVSLRTTLSGILDHLRRDGHKRGSITVEQGVVIDDVILPRATRRI
jgi:hypothetical protein